MQQKFRRPQILKSWRRHSRQILIKPWMWLKMLRCQPFVVPTGNLFSPATPINFRMRPSKNKSPNNSTKSSRRTRFSATRQKDNDTMRGWNRPNCERRWWRKADRVGIRNLLLGLCIQQFSRCGATECMKKEFLVTSMKKIPGTKNIGLCQGDTTTIGTRRPLREGLQGVCQMRGGGPVTRRMTVTPRKSPRSSQRRLPRGLQSMARKRERKRISEKIEKPGLRANLHMLWKKMIPQMPPNEFTKSHQSTGMKTCEGEIETNFPDAVAGGKKVITIWSWIRSYAMQRIIRHNHV